LTYNRTLLGPTGIHPYPVPNVKKDDLYRHPLHVFRAWCSIKAPLHFN